MTLYFPNEEITIYRARRVGTSNKYAVSATYTAYQSDIQPASLERSQFVNGGIGATFIAFVDVDVDIKESDEIRTADGKRYAVRGVERWQNAGLLDHLELTLVSMDG